MSIWTQALAGIIAASTLAMTAACTSDGIAGDPATTPTSPGTATTAPPTTSTTVASPGRPVRPSLTDPVECRNDVDGYTISYPGPWETNEGDVVAMCSMFDPDPFEVPEGTDARVAAISIYRDPVPFSELPAIPPTAKGALVAIDGHQAMRVEGATDGEGLFAPGTRFVRYRVDLDTGLDDAAGTLFADAIETGCPVEFTTAVRTLDLMMRTLDLHATGPSGAATVAVFEGGGTPAGVVGSKQGEDICFGLAHDELSTCVAPASTPALASLDAPGEITVGRTSGAVFQVEAELTDRTLRVLPVRLDAETGASGWALPIAADRIVRIVHRDVDGEVLESYEGPAGVAPEPIGSFGTAAVETAGFPGSGRPAFLTDVSITENDTFDRVVFSFAPTVEDLTYLIEWPDEVMAISGQVVPLAGDSILAVRLSPASRVDLSGEQPELYYPGPDRLVGTGSPLHEVALVADFEGLMTWALGLDSGTEYAVDVDEDRGRLVIDVRSGG